MRKVTLLQHLKSPLALLVLVDFFIITATSMSQPFWPLIIKTHLPNDQPSSLHLWSAFIYSAPLVATMLFAPMWGRLADRFGYKKMVLRAAIGLCVTQAIIGVAPSLTLIAACRIVQGIFSGFIASVQALATNTATESKQQTTIANLQSATALGTLFGPLFAGLILDHSNYHWMFALSTSLCALSTAMIIFLIPEPKKKQHQHLSRANSALTSGSNYYLALILLAQTARFMLLPIFALFVIDTLSGNQIQTGLLYAISGGALFLFAPIVARYHQKQTGQGSPWQLIILALLTCTVLQVILALNHSFTLALIIRALWGASLAALLPLFYSLLIKSNHPSNKGKVLGFGNSASKCGNLIGITLGASLASVAGITNTILLSGGVYFLAFALAVALQFKGLNTAVRNTK